MMQPAMRTVQLGKGWFPEESGGLNRYYQDLLRHLPGQGVGVVGLVAGSDRVVDGSSGMVRAFAPSRASLPVRWNGARVHTRRELEESPDGLLVTHFALYAAPCLDLPGPRPFVVHFHGPWAEESRADGAGAVTTAIKRRLESRVYRRAARCIVLSRAFAEVLQQHGVAGDRIRVIPGGVDAQRFAPTANRTDARTRLGWPLDRPIALVVRRLVRRMGLEDLIEGVRLARILVPDLLVLIAGRGPLWQELSQRISAAGVTANVRLLGFVPDEQLPLAYRAADLSLVPSVALEGFGLIVAESLASGTPVLVTAVGGLPETVEGFAPHCVLPERTPAALGRALAAALHGDLALPSADACVRHARDRFDWPAIAQRVRGVYQEVSA